jgi:hypothetical protein
MRWKGNYNIANYVDYDSTTFFLDITKGTKWVVVDFPNLNTHDVTMFVGVPDNDNAGVGNISWDGSTVTPDSVILDSAVYTKKFRKSDGTRITQTRVYIWWTDGYPADRIAFTFVWGTAATGRIKIGWED